MYKLRNQSEQTVRKQPSPLTLQILHQGKSLTQVQLHSHNTVGDLIELVRHKLARHYQHIIGLASYEGYFTLDFALQQPKHKLTGIRNNQRLNLVLQELVAEETGPTLADFRFLACLGEGATAGVFLVRHVQSGQLFALKQIKKQNLREFKNLESVLRQKKILTEIVVNQGYFTQLEASFESQHYLNLLLEVYPGGELFYHLSQRKLTEDEAKICFAEVLLGMEQLHKQKVLYRDLKPENIMIDFDGHLRIGDFGLCRINLDQEQMAFSHCGSPEYMAFETKSNEGYSYPADFYTMGAIIYEMVQGMPPYFNGRPLCFENTSSAFRQLVQAMIRPDPSQRLCNYHQIKHSRWLRTLNWTRIKKNEENMPTKLSLYTNYIHSEFIEKEFDWQALRQEGRYDRLFDMFSYLRQHPQGIYHYYPLAKFGKRNTKHRVSKQNSRRSSGANSRHSSQSGKSGKAKSNLKGDKPDFFRKKTNKPNLYTSLGMGKTSQKERVDRSMKSKPKSRNGSSTSRGVREGKREMGNCLPREPLMNVKSPIKFKTLTSVKSVGNLKGISYMKELDRSASKRNKMH